MCSLVLLCSPAEVRAQEPETQPASRTELRRQLRLQKLTRLEPPNPPKVKRAMVWIETRGRERLENFNFYRFFPKFGGLSTGSGFAFGTRYWNPRIRGSAWDVQASAAASFAGYQLADLQVGHVMQPERSLTIFADLRYRDFPQEDFFGLGPESRRGNRTNYRIEDAYAGSTVRFHKDRVKAEVRGGFYQVNIRTGTDERFPDAAQLFSDAEAPGLARQPNFFLIGASMQLDWRDQPGNAQKGGSVDVAVERYDDLNIREFNFTRVAAETTYFFPLWASGRTFALRFLTSLDIEDKGNRVPFYLQRTLGGSERLRGFREFRFRDRNLTLLTAEYRWDLIPALEFAFFYDAGKVFPRRSDFNLDNLQTSFGFGMRVKTRSSVVLRIDLAHSREGTRAYLKFGPVF